MLLRRYQEHLSTQNWTAIFLDFFIVVAGLYLGLQLDGWNEERKEATREREYLEQLQADFTKNVEVLQWLGENHEAMSKNLMHAIGVIKAGEIEPGEEEKFKWAILTMRQVPPMSLHMAGYRALVAAGDFSLLSDRELRSLLVSIESEIEFDQNAYWRNMGDSLGFTFDVMLDISRTVPHPSGRGVAFELDFAAIRDYPGTLAVLANARRTHSQITEARYQLRDMFLEAGKRIDISLGSAQMAGAVPP